MENINNDIKKLTTVLESTQNVSNDNESSDDEEFVQNTDSFLPASITNDEDTIFIIETCTDPLIKNALICNIKKRNILNELIKNLEENLTKIKSIQRENFIRSLNGNTLTKKNVIRKRLGIPYFKDSNFFPSPANDDYTLMQKNKHFSVLDCVKKENWSSFHKCLLVKAVYETICVNKSKEIQTEIRNLEDLKIKDKDTFLQMISLQEKIIALNNTELIDSIAKQWQYIKIIPHNCVLIKNKAIDKTDDTYYILTIINNWEISSTDWQTISDEYFEQKFSPMECEAMWSCYLHPKYCKEPWKEYENTKLQELVEKWNYENWDTIAAELDIQKSAYQCCIHFYSKLYDKFLRTKWTVEEEQLLKELVEASRIGDYINWAKISHYFKGRTKAQIYAHYYRSMLPSLIKGTFTIEEDVLLLTLLKLNNNDMKKVKLYFPARSLPQLRDRFKTMSRDDSQDWTLKDDCRIIEHVEQHGARKWYLLDDMNRSNASIRTRYLTLKRWFEQNPTDNIEDVQRRYKSAYRRKIKTRFNLLNIAVQQLLKIVQKHPSSSDDKAILNLDYIHKKVLNRIPLYKTLKKNKSNTSLYKNKSKTRKQKTVNSEGTLYNYCLNFFQPAYKKITRSKYSEDFAAKAKRVWNILELLGAKLNLPSNEEEINENMLLTSSDKSVVHEMIKLRSTQPERKEKLQLKSLIPPTPETLIGLRGLMLHSTVLRSHSRGNYEGYTFYVNLEQRFEKKGVNYIKRRNEVFLSSLKKDDKQMVIANRALFWKRMKILFSWPCIMQDTKIAPAITETPPEEIIESPTSIAKKRGRPIKPTNKAWKIDLMNKARLEKKKPVENLNLPLNEPSTSKESTFKLTKHEDNSFSIEFKSIPQPQCSSTSTSIKKNAENKQELLTMSDDSDDELDEDIQKIVMATKINEKKIHTDNAVINQMSKAIKDSLVKTNETNIPEKTDDTNKRKAKKIAENKEELLTTSDSDDELDEDIQKIVMATKMNERKINTDNAVINQMSKAIKDILVKTNETNIPEKTNDTNKRKAKIIVIPSKKVKINNLDE